jgi:hypothetical protein
MDSPEPIENFDDNHDIDMSTNESEFFQGVKAPGSIEKSRSNIKRNVTRKLENTFPDMKV